MTTEKTDQKSLVEVHTEIDQRDDSQIMEYLAGGVVDEYVYAFKDKAGGMTVGLSWAGTREMAQARHNIRIDQQPEISDCDGYWRGMAMAEDTIRNVAIWGGCHQPKKMRVHVYDQEGKDTGEFVEIDDPFAFEKCVAKCQRNALKAILPVSAITKFIVGYCESNNIPLPVKLRKTQKSLQAKKPVIKTTTPPVATGKSPELLAVSEQARLVLRKQLTTKLIDGLGMNESQALAWLGTDSTDSLSIAELNFAILCADEAIKTKGGVV